MTQEDILRMAREAGFSEWALQTPQDLERFAALVAAAARADEREACAVIGDSMDSLQDGAIGRAIRARGQA